MTRIELVQKLHEPLHITWKNVVIGAAIIIPWAMTITVGVALNARDLQQEHEANVAQQATLDQRASAIGELEVVKNDIGWIKRTLARIERKLFGHNSDDEEAEQ